jgi:phosphomannomutase
VTNLSTSRVVDDAAAEFGGRVIHAPVGEVNVAMRIRAENAAIGGEGNGGVILPELHLGRDAPLGVALVLQMLTDDPRPISRIVAGAPRYAIIKDKLTRPDAPLDTVYASLRAAFPDAAADTQDGLRLGWVDRWVHIRPSGTEPVVRVIAEAPTAGEARTLVDRGRELLAKVSAGTSAR